MPPKGYKPGLGLYDDPEPEPKVAKGLTEQQRMAVEAAGGTANLLLDELVDAQSEFDEEPYELGAAVSHAQLVLERIDKVLEA